MDLARSETDHTLLDNLFAAGHHIESHLLYSLSLTSSSWTFGYVSTDMAHNIRGNTHRTQCCRSPIASLAQVRHLHCGLCNLLLVKGEFDQRLPGKRRTILLSVGALPVIHLRLCEGRMLQVCLSLCLECVVVAYASIQPVLVGVVTKLFPPGLCPVAMSLAFGWSHFELSLFVVRDWRDTFFGQYLTGQSE